MSLSQAISRHSEVFTEIYRRTIEVGERTGQLEAVLRELADHIEKQDALGKKLKGALTYPMIMGIVGVGVTIILLTVVLPPLTALFSSLEADLPITTKIMMGASVGFGKYMIHIGVGVTVLVIGVIAGLRHPKGLRFKATMGLKLPLLGTPAVMGELSRISRTMALMLGAGLSLQDTMEILPRTTSNLIFKESLEEVRQQLFLGQGLAYPMAANPLFPPLMLQMVRVGEDSNTLPVTMKVVADFYETTAQEKTAAMISLVTPLSTVIMAAGVTFVALSVIMPMYNLTSAF